uniref:Uncharacterized protein n=1 Tax=Arundo donax TaxID=35708 RepID=A0A0A9DLC7_ARUDO
MWSANSVPLRRSCGQLLLAPEGIQMFDLIKFPYNFI